MKGEISSSRLLGACAAAAAVVILTAFPEAVHAVGLRQKALLAVTGCLGGKSCPDGEYLSSCTGCSANSNGVLSCTCPDDNGNPQTTTLLNSFSCAPHIINNNGALACELPSGDYDDYCAHCGVSYGGGLTCICPNAAGQMVPTSLSNAAECSSVTYANYALVCVTDAPTSAGLRQVLSSEIEEDSSASNSTCVWSESTAQRGETTPTASCASKASLQGCTMNNFCCWNLATNTCGPVNGCPDCVTLTEDECGSAPSGCCSFNSENNVCQRLCPAGPLFDFCPLT